MTRLRPILTSFNAGELSPRMGGRVDTAIYNVAVETCENFVPVVEGPIVKRPGFEYITAAPDDAAWLTAFRFNTTQSYALLWCDQRWQFYTHGFRIETAPGAPLEVASPYAGADAPMVSAQQSYDRLYLDHAKYPPGRLSRTGAATFAYEAVQLVNGPFADANSDDTVTVVTDGITGDIDITASADIFADGHVGGLFRIEALDFAAIQAWQVGIDGINVGDKRRNAGKVYQAVALADDDGRTGTVAPTHTTGTAWDGSTGNDINDKGPYGVQWLYLYDQFGIAKITGFTDARHVSATVTRRLPDSIAGTPTWKWAHGLFSDAAGYPNIVIAWKSRLIHWKGFDIAASVSGDYLNHATFDESGILTDTDMAFRLTLAAADPVLWAAADRQMVVGTASVEFAIGPTNPQLAISGTNFDANPQSFYGSHPVFPLQSGTSIFFLQRGGTKLREAQYEFSADRYTAANATVWARHITAGGIRQLAFQQNPEELLIGVRGDGQLIVHPHQPEQDVKGFARIRHSDGRAKILSAVAIASADGLTDELYVLVERNGAKSVERMAAWRDDEDPIEEAFFVDSGVRGTAAANQLHFSGLDHLAAETIVGLVAGGVVNNLVVTESGELTLSADDIPADTAYAYAFGLPFTATCTTLRPELKIQGETSQGKRQRLIKIVLRLLGTLGITVGPKGGKLDNLIDRPANAAMDAPIPLFDGDSERTVSGGYDRTGQAQFVSRDPLPATIVAAMPTVDVEEPKP